MADGDAPPELTELVYVPEPSWQPAVIAIGVGFLLAGIFMGWFYSAVGAVLLIVAAVAWAREAADSRDRLPRRQETTSAVLPATPMRRAARR